MTQIVPNYQQLNYHAWENPNLRKPKIQTGNKDVYIGSGAIVGAMPETIQEGGSIGGYKSRGADRWGEAR